MEPTGLAYIPNGFCHLHGSAVWSRMTSPQQHRYNQLCGLMAAEQFLSFEETVIIAATARLARRAEVTSDVALAADLDRMIREECRHAGWFRDLLTEVEPGFYAGGKPCFIRLRWWERLLLRPLTRTRDGALLMLWFTLLIEEHSLVLSRAMLADADSLDARFVAVHRRHLADEERHLPINQRLLERCFDPLPRWRRLLLAGVLRKLLRNCARPRRAGMAVLERLLVEFPALCSERLALRQAVRDDFRDHAPLSDITLPESHPVTVAALHQRPEFVGIIRDFERGWRAPQRGPGFRLVLLLGLQVMGSSCYAGVAWLSQRLQPEAPPLPMTAIDRALPELPAAILAYQTLGIYLLLPAWSDPVRFFRLVRAALLASLVAYACFLIAPFTMVRGPLPEGQPWRSMTVLLYDLDTNRNTMPSLHVAYAILVACVCSRGRWLLPISAWGAMIAVSAVLTGQHGVLDAAAGALLAVVCWRVAR